ncbi:hypothetical protein AB0H73_00230 [Streptomyces olivoreticuli]
MPIPSSSAPAARRWLYQQLTAQLIPDPVNASSSLLVVYDQPGPGQPDDIVAVGKVARQIDVDSLVGSGGAGWLSERYQVDVTVDVFRGGDDAQAAYERGAALADQVCAVVRADPTMGGAVLVARPVSSTHEVEWDEEHLGRHCVSVIEIDCFQRI